MVNKCTVMGAGDGRSVYVYNELKQIVATCPNLEIAQIVAKRLSTPNFQDMQDSQLAWVKYNFPKQLGDVTEDEVMAVIEHAGNPRQAVEAITKALNAGQLVKKKYHGLLGAAEEIGELCHVFLKAEQGIRKSAGSSDPDAWKIEAGDCIADCIIFLLSFCNTHGIDMQTEVEKAWAEVSKRDWVRYPDTGRPQSRAINDGAMHPGDEESR